MRSTITMPPPPPGTRDDSHDGALTAPDTQPPSEPGTIGRIELALIDIAWSPARRLACGVWTALRWGGTSLKYTMYLFLSFVALGVMCVVPGLLSGASRAFGPAVLVLYFGLLATYASMLFATVVSMVGFWVGAARGRPR